MQTSPSPCITMDHLVGTWCAAALKDIGTHLMLSIRRVCLLSPVACTDVVASVLRVVTLATYATRCGVCPGAQKPEATRAIPRGRAGQPPAIQDIQRRYDPRQWCDTSIPSGAPRASLACCCVPNHLAPHGLPPKPLQDLKHLMAAHGGRFANYYSKDVVTHIVCDNLPDTKLKQMLKSRSSLPVVQAAWVVHSIAAGTLLPPSQFAIDRLTLAPAQQQLAPFAQRPAVTLDKSAIYGQLSTNPPATPPAPTPSAPSHPTPAQDRARPPTGQHSSHHSQHAQHAAAQPQPQHHTSPALNTTPPAEPSTREHSTPSSPTGLSGPRAPPGGLVPVDPAQPRPQPTWTPEQIAAAQRTAQAMRAACDVLKGPPKSTADDPQFLQTYFRASRLHFIGTWRMRIEQLVRKESLAAAPASAPLPPPASTAGTERCGLDTPPPVPL